MLKCILRCTKPSGKVLVNRGHWHCCHCSRIFDRKTAITVHFNTLLKEKETPSKEGSRTVKGDTTAPDQQRQLGSPVGSNRRVCPECSKGYPNNKALQRHMRDQHKRKLEPVVGPGRHLKEICVDFERGIFMISRTFSGTMHPIHCVHKTHTPHNIIPVPSSCEINECTDAARVARQSGHPAFECIHLQSAQYALPFKTPVTLRDNSLDEIAGGELKWISEKQKQSLLSHRQKACDDGSPLVVRFENENSARSGRLVYLSVYDGGVHYWSRFGRVVVAYDTQTGKWSCACSRAKVSCLHKAMSKWFLYQQDSALLRQSPQVSEDETETGEEVADSQEPPLAAGSLYPPTGKALEDVIVYQLASKKIPAAIHRHDKEDLPSELVPREMECHRCNNPLRGPIKITGRAIIIGITTCTTGMSFNFTFDTEKCYQVGNCIFFSLVKK